MAARKQVARGHGDIPTENKPKPRQSARNPQASAPTQRAASTSKSAALSIEGGDNNTNNTPIKKNHRHYTTDEIVNALMAKGGIISNAAKSIGCGRDVIYKRKHEPEIAEAIERGRYFLVDDAEIALIDRVQAEDTTAIIFTLKTLGKSRGYVERVEHAVTWRDELKDAGIDPDQAASILAKALEQGVMND